MTISTAHHICVGSIASNITAAGWVQYYLLYREVVNSHVDSYLMQFWSLLMHINPTAHVHSCALPVRKKNKFKSCMHGYFLAMVIL